MELFFQINIFRHVRTTTLLIIAKKINKKSQTSLTPLPADTCRISECWRYVDRTPVDFGISRSWSPW